MINLGIGDKEEVFTIDFDDNGDIIEVEETTETTEVEEEVVEEETPEEVKEPAVEEEIVEEEEVVEDDNPYSVFASVLKEKDFLPDITDEDLEDIASEDDLAGLMNKQIDSVVLQQLEEVNGKSYGAVSHFLNGGTVEEFASKFGKGGNVLSYTEDVIKEDEEVQRKIAETYYKKTTKLSEKRIKKLVDNTVEVDGEDEVLEMYEQLKEFDKKDKEDFAKQTKQREADILKQQEARDIAFQTTTNSYKEFIPGRTVDKKTKDKVYNSIQPTLEKINKDLTKYAPILSYLDHYGLLEGDFNKVLKDAQTKETSRLSSVIKGTSFSRKSNKKVKTTGEEEDMKKLLKNSLRGSLLD